jgi:hypothetical protein
VWTRSIAASAITLAGSASVTRSRFLKLLYWTEQPDNATGLWNPSVDFSLLRRSLLSKRRVAGEASQPFALITNSFGVEERTPTQFEPIFLVTIQERNFKTPASGKVQQ